MRNAEIAQVGTPRELYEAPTDVFVATFMVEASRLRGEMSGPPGDQGLVRLDGLSLQLPRRGLANGEVVVMVRPESVVVEPGEPGALRGTVATATYMGSHAEYILTTAAGELFAIVREAGALRASGEAVGIGLLGHGVYAFAA
jgi:iron(III) transport system ATP-binding protein